MVRQDEAIVHVRVKAHDEVAGRRIETMQGASVGEVQNRHGPGAVDERPLPLRVDINLFDDVETLRPTG